MALTRKQQYPEVLEKLLNNWLGFNDDEITIFGTSQDTIVNLSADVEKQEAVVKAFKVRSFPLRRYLNCNVRSSARMACLWYVLYYNKNLGRY